MGKYITAYKLTSSLLDVNFIVKDWHANEVFLDVKLIKEKPYL